MTRGWRRESERHSLASRGIKTNPRNKFMSRGVSYFDRTIDDGFKYNIISMLYVPDREFREEAYVIRLGEDVLREYLGRGSVYSTSVCIPEKEEYDLMGVIHTHPPDHNTFSLNDINSLYECPDMDFIGIGYMRLGSPFKKEGEGGKSVLSRYPTLKCLDGGFRRTFPSLDDLMKASKEVRGFYWTDEERMNALLSDYVETRTLQGA